MGKRLFEAEVARYGRDGFLFPVSGAVTATEWRGSLAVLGLLACLLIGGCAQRATSTGEEQRQGGFYGGISAGNGM